MKRDHRLWFPVILAAGGSLFILALLLLPKLSRGHRLDPHPGPADAQDNRPDVPPWMTVSYLESALQDTVPDLRVIRRSGSASCLVIGPDVDAAALDGLLPTEDFADCWRGVVLCEADWAVLNPDEAAKPDGPHACRVGDFRLFGDLQLMERIRPAVDRINFGPYGRGRVGDRPLTPAALPATIPAYSRTTPPEFVQQQADERTKLRFGSAAPGPPAITHL